MVSSIITAKQPQTSTEHIVLDCGHDVVFVSYAVLDLFQMIQMWNLLKSSDLPVHRLLLPKVFIRMDQEWFDPCVSSVMSFLISVIVTVES